MLAHEALDQFAEALSAAGSVLFITGAGLSADSGLPTYRGIGGLYEDAETDDGLPIEELLSARCFAHDPGLTWKYIRQIEEACRGAQANVAHTTMAQLERGSKRVWVLTQNVDGLHRAAGSDKVIDIHGDVYALHCTSCAWESRVETYEGLPALPRCPDCASVVRPRVVLFGEALPTAALELYERELARGFDLIVSVGTSSLFPYIAGPVIHAASAGARSVEVNPGETVVSEFVNLRVELGAAAAMRGVAERLGLPL